jgi:hypothetical protein
MTAFQSGANRLWLVVGRGSCSYWRSGPRAAVELEIRMYPMSVESHATASVRRFFVCHWLVLNGKT